MKKYILIFGYTKLHAIFARELEEEFFVKGYKVVNFYRRNTAGLVGDIFLRVRNVVVFFWCRVLLLLGRDISILTPHPEQLLANFFFFSSRVKKRYVYEDGLMNYLYVQLPDVLVERSRKRRWLAGLLLYRFVTVKGYLSGCEQRNISGAFVRVPEMMFMPEMHGDLFKINIAANQSWVPDEDVAIFVDQDIESIYSKETAGEVRRSIYEKMKGLKKVYIKPHHNYWSKEERFRDVPENFELLSCGLQELTAEDVVVRVNAGSVWGFFSSALINSVAMFPNIECYSCTPLSHTVTTVVGDIPMADLLARFGVKAV